MSALKLFAFPKACSLASHIALELTGGEFSVEFLDLPAGAQRDASFLALNPKGKVPALVADGRAFNENVAILTWLAARYPSAHILPEFGSDDMISALSDCAWFASGIHPLVTRALAPARFVDQPDCEASARSSALSALERELGIANARLAGRDWFYDAFSAVDGYFFVLWSRAVDASIDIGLFPDLVAHADRVRDVPAVQRAIARETAAVIGHP